MNLYLMRHANAGVPRENAALDCKRALIKEGKEQCMLMGRVLGALKVQVDVIVSSPLKRSLQTAQFVGTELGFDGRVESSASLAPGGEYHDFQDLLVKYADREGVLAVGHNPTLFQFMGRMITGNGGAAIRMRKGSIAKIDFSNHPPRLQWLIDPRTARALLTAPAKKSRTKSSRPKKSSRK
jgi:phosphohistidine phosphatase